MLVVAGVVAAAFVLAYVLITYYPDLTERWYRRLTKTSRTLWLAFTLVAALLFVGSGYVPLQIVGFAYIVLFALKLMLDYDAPIREVLP